MGLLNNDYQHAISPSFRMPVDDTASDRLSDIANETIQFYYVNSAKQLVEDLGESAGTLVVGHLGYTNIRTNLGEGVATSKDTSLQLTVGAETLKEVPISYKMAEVSQIEDINYKITFIGGNLKNGEYVVDYVHGFFIYRKTSNATTALASFKVISSTITAGGSTGGGGALPVVEQNKPVAENNVQGWIDTQFKPSVSAVNKTEEYSNYGTAITQMIKNAQGAVFACWGENRAGSTVYLQFHDTIAALAGGAVPKISIPVPANSMFEFKTPFYPNGKVFLNGITMAWSTTAGTYTAIALAGDQMLQVNYV